MAIASAACSSSGSTASTTFSVGGTLTGLSGTVVLQNNAGDDLSLTADGAFTFTTELADAATYAVTVLTQPSGQVCTVSSGTGTIASADVTDVTVTCGIGVSSVTGTVLSASGAVADTAIATTGTTGVAGSAATPLTVTFSTTIDVDTLSNLTLTCGGESVEGGSVTPLTNATEYTLAAPTTTGLPPLTSCVLNFPATITDVDGNPITASTYTFTTGCSTDDNFAVDTVTGGCWSTTAATPLPAVNTTDDILSFTFGAATTYPPNTPGAYKTFATITNGLIATTKITSNAPDMVQIACALLVATDTNISPNQNALVGISSGAQAVFFHIGASGLEDMRQIADGSGAYVCLKVATNGAVTVGQAATADACDPSTDVTGADAGTIPATGSAIISLTSGGMDADSQTCTFDDFTVTDIAGDALTATAPLYEY